MQKNRSFINVNLRPLWDLPLEEPKLTLATADEVAAKLPEILAEIGNETLTKKYKFK